MSRPRKNPLPEGIYVRQRASGPAYWISFRDQSGQRRREPAGTTLEEAKRLLADRRRAVAEGTYAPGGLTGGATLSSYAAAYFVERESRTKKREEQLFRDFVEPTLGAVALRDLRPKQVVAWLRSFAHSGMATKSVHNAHGVLSGILGRACFDELVIANVSRGLPPGSLPALVASRKRGSWTRDEVTTLITDERIPEDRRVVYIIAGFTGARLGEIAGLRWRDLDTRARPLWRWALSTQYDGQPLKTDRPRDVPIHPELQRVLAAWKLEGFPRLVMRVARPDDFVVPREDGSVHSDNSLGSKAVHRHARLVGIDPTDRDFHSFRRFFVTHARVDGASGEQVERITHNARGAMIDTYTLFGWDALCETVGKLRLDVRRSNRVVPLKASAAGHRSGHQSAEGGVSALESGSILLEAAGVEPASESALLGHLRA